MCTYNPRFCNFTSLVNSANFLLIIMAILFSVGSVSRSSSPAAGDQLPLVSVDEPNYAANLQKTMKSTVAFAAITAVAGLAITAILFC